MSLRCLSLRQVRCVKSYRPAGHGACARCGDLGDEAAYTVSSRRLTECQTYTALYKHFDGISASNFVCESARIPCRLSIGNPTPEKQSSVDTDGDRPAGEGGGGVVGDTPGLNGTDAAKKHG